MSGLRDEWEPPAMDPIAAGLRLQQELERVLGGFAQEHAELIRAACRVQDTVTDLTPVVATTMYGHTLSHLRRLHGREHAERLTVTLLEQLERAEIAANRAREALH